VAQDSDGIKALRFALDGSLVLMSRDGAPKGKLIRLDAPALARAASGKPVDWKKVPVLVPEGEGTIENFVINGQQLVVADIVGGPSRLRSFSMGKTQARAITLPPVSGIADLVDLGKAGVVAEVSSYLRPSAWMHVEAGKAPRASALVRTSAVNYEDCEVIRELATSKDGTQVPVNIVRRKGTVLNGHNPVLLYGYGGYSISETPRFSGSRRVFLDRGGIWVDANLRGGGEFGEAWHRAGNLTNKQNVFDDFIAAAEHLIKRGYTNPQRLAIMGGSNGGLLMGAVMTQRPDLFRAVVSAVGIYDMLRVELDPNGAFNVTEFGSVKDPAQFKALAAYSPLHKVKDGTSYPAVLMQTGDNDGRVNPAHSRKMMARLQAADPTGGPFLLSTSATSGHGIGTALDERIGQDTDVWGFVIQQLITSQPAP
jgi:prolyl oligopeptidase